MSQERFEQAWLDDPRMVQRDACGVGFIASIKGHKSHKIVTEGLEILRRMDHRGGRAADDVTSDGAGVLTQIPHELFQGLAQEQQKVLPEAGAYAVGFFFLPKERAEQEHWSNRIDELARKWQVLALMRREVPVDNRVLGPIGAGNEPAANQWVFTDAISGEETTFTWRLYRMRKELEEEGRTRYGIKQLLFYCVSLSRETICYKGLILAKDLATYYRDLKDERFTSAFAMVHQRFSTNTMPSWPLAQPFRALCHTGKSIRCAAISMRCMPAPNCWEKPVPPMISPASDRSARPVSAIRRCWIIRSSFWSTPVGLCIRF